MDNQLDRRIRQFVIEVVDTSPSSPPFEGIRGGRVDVVEREYLTRVTNPTSDGGRDTIPVNHGEGASNG